MFFAAVTRAHAELVNALVGLALFAGLAVAMVQPAMAASTACGLINSDWAGVVTPVGDEYFLEYSGLYPGEVITYSVTTTGSTNDPQNDPNSGPGFAVYINQGSGNYDVVLEQYAGSGAELNLSGQYTVSANPDITLYAWSSISNPGKSHALISCAGTPVVTGVSPTSGPTAGGTSVTITGTDLLNATAVRFGATNAASFIVNSATSITATSPAGTGTVDVTVTTPGGTSATSAADQFTYVAAPTVTSLSTTAGPTGGGTTVTIVGTGFSIATAVTFGGTPASTFTINSPTSITAVAPAGSAGTVDVRVTTVGGTSATGPSDQFTYVPRPTVTSLTATAGRATGGMIVIITGTGFAAAPGVGAVKFGGTTASYIITSNTQIAATSPAGSGTVDVTVTTVGGTSAYSAADQYTYVPAPTVTGVSPSGGPTGGGTTVTIIGTGFLRAPATWAVYFGGTAVSYTVDSDTQITATSPADVGTVDVTVTTVGGTSATSAASQFTYVPAPTIVLVGPDAGPTEGRSVGIYGTNLLGATAVTFGGIAATDFSVVTDTAMFATAPAGSAGTVDVRVTTLGGTSAIDAAAQFTYVAAPTVTSITPTAGPTMGGTSVIITGNDLSGTTAVTFGATPATGFTVDSDSQITAAAPALSAGTVDVRVTTVGGTSATGAADQFTAVAAPAVTSVSPNVVPAGVSTTVTITGTNLSGASAVTFGFGVAASSFTVNGDTSITATSPPLAGNAYAMLVTTVGGTSPVVIPALLTVVAAPTITGLSLASAPNAGGSTVVITGTELTAVTGVSFGATPAAFAIDTDTQITAIAPAGVGHVNVQATSIGGTSPDTAADDFVYLSIADAPMAATAVAGDGQATVTFTAPAHDGNSPITLYTATASPNGATGTLAGPGAGTITVAGLTNGQAYTFTVTATNDEGDSIASAASNSVMPKGNQTITFANPGNQNFGTNPTLSAMSTSGATPTFTSTSTGVCTITPSGLLTFVAAGTCAIDADEPGGTAWNAAATVSQSFTVNAVVPDAPVMVGATISGTTAEISFTPASTGGSPIIEYTATAVPGGGTATGITSPIAFGGLTIGQSYSFTVTARNSVGTGSASGASNTVTANTAQTITFPDPGLLLAGGNATLTATASSGLPVSYNTTTPAVCSVTTSGALSLLTAGACIVEVNQAGDSTYLAAPTVSLSLAVAPGSVTLTPTTGALPDGKVGDAHTQVFSAADGTAPYVFGVSAGTLPAGLTLTGDTLSGTPTAAGTFGFTVTATDANGVSASAAYTLVVVPSAVITLTPAAGALPDAMAGENYTETVVASGQVGAVTYAATGTLPAGLAVGATSGEITGSVDVGAEGDYSFTVTATDADANTASVSYTLKVLVREVTVENKAVTVPAGSTPVPVNLTAGATGGPFSGGEVVGVSPPQAGTASITGADVAAIDSDYDAIYLRFTPNPQYTGTAQITYALTSTQGASAQGTVAYTLTADLGAVAQAIQPISDGFISTRSGLIAGAVDTPGLQDRRSAGSAQLPGTISVTPSGNSMTMNFAASTLAATAASTAAESLVSAPVDEGGLNFWIDGTATLHFRNDSVGDHWGSLALASVGADMLLTDDLLVGVALHADWMDDVTGASRTAGTGVLVGPYVSAELVEGVFLDASAYYGQSWNTITSGLFSGTFETHRLLAKASLSGQWQLSDNLMLQPAANLFYLHEEAGNYAVSDGLGNTANIASFALDQLRASVGATLRYSIDVDGNLVITPFLGVELGLGVTNGTSSRFGTLSTGFDVTGLGEWTLGFGVEAGIDNGTLRSISATGRARANF
ncbi:IPT/TIG domain-containing protein [Devosia sp. SL43]|uniref:IPT/TIG domain-containing protein n=1 Tax=Devosia sp. SL43 TaxID=2806348 RepID=UPI001F1649F7|nr:IPT/TIG domain-containing protein [Devosia sp. SL43]UJW85878.1 IPT/TIG domain-containing protein [Devosia sp. SL43]